MPKFRTASLGWPGSGLMLNGLDRALHLDESIQSGTYPTGRDLGKVNVFSKMAG
jgi:hypothetical protein